MPVQDRRTCLSTTMKTTTMTGPSTFSSNSFVQRSHTTRPRSVREPPARARCSWMLEWKRAEAMAAQRTRAPSIPAQPRPRHGQCRSTLAGSRGLWIRGNPRPRNPNETLSTSIILQRSAGSPWMLSRRLPGSPVRLRGRQQAAATPCRQQLLLTVPRQRRDLAGTMRLACVPSELVAASSIATVRHEVCPSRTTCSRRSGRGRPSLP
mmetsp:Transcript_28449/g.75106  ORF Transcript_28449/g.75106 Transcript_28449/m.75106 type:complete len:208 (-) Transcript_28449:564-1187(-)